ncbi:DUF6282 family protein [Nocardioides zeae]|uniref:DUF6282 family protein n=1 Tax=Nocardioides imazamoxiresistens TaxID=3231893 RepID=A0ABU3PUD7_9ACTN|nr:DUF6282 family protein [Nocardioides zeae]MDT9592840.1 DUF6282 family protein [Nocardioides zeae]
MTTIEASTVDRALEGLVDMHCHSGPSPMPREFDHAEGARDGWDRLRMRALVAKCHHHNTQMDVLSQRSLLADIPTEVIGAVALNTTVGGLNLSQVQLCLGLGGKVVYLPTVSSGRHIDCHAENLGFPTPTVKLSAERIEVVRDGQVVPELLPIFDEVAAHDAVLNGGHLHPEDIAVCFAAARDRGVTKFVVSHPDFVLGAEPEQCAEYVANGALIEHELHMYDPGARMQWPVEQLLRWITTLGPENTLIGSDLGQAGFPRPVDAFRRVGAALLELGLPEADLRTIVHDNPRRLLSLEG